MARKRKRYDRQFKNNRSGALPLLPYRETYMLSLRIRRTSSLVKAL